MKRIVLILLCAALLLAVCAACGGGKAAEPAAPAVEAVPAAEAAPAAPEAPAAAPAEVTWEDYQNWLIDTFGSKSPNPEGYAELVRSYKSWDEVDPATQPWDKILGENAFHASTFEEFVAAGGVGTYNTEYEDSNEGTGEPPSGEPSGEPTAEPPAGNG